MAPGARILVVEPDAALGAVLRDALEAELRLLALLAPDAATAHRLLNEDAPELVLLATALPGRPGATAVAAHARQRGLPVVAMTTIRASLEAPRLGQSAVLEKPFRIATLALLVRESLGVAHARRSRCSGTLGAHPQTRH